MLLELRTESPKVVRRNKQVPGVFYGRGFGPYTIKVDEPNLKKTFQTYRMNLPFTVKLNGNEYQAYIKDVQFDMFNSKKMIHFDLMRISTDSLIKAKVAINLIGRDQIEKGSTFIELVTSEIEAEYTVENAIASIDIDVSKLQVGDVIHVKDLIVPENVTILTDPESVVFAVKDTSVIVDEALEGSESITNESNEQEEASE
ncbi:MAG TPA: 50S ribosomal protein L25 [Bacilli bacterium]|nr:50S ribosomal protein L25 [Bacilli bacterium]